MAEHKKKIDVVSIRNKMKASTFENKDEIKSTIEFIETNCPAIAQAAEDILEEEKNYTKDKNRKFIYSKVKTFEKDLKSIDKYYNKFVLTELAQFEVADEGVFLKEKKGIDIIRKMLIEIAENSKIVPNKEFYDSYRAKLKIFYSIYRIKKFVLTFKDLFKLEIHLTSEHQTIKLIDDLLWKIPELKNKKKEQRFKCISKTYEETKDNTIQMDHVVDRAAVIKYFSSFGDGKMNDAQIVTEIDRIMPYLFGCSIPKDAHHKITHHSIIEDFIDEKHPFRMYLTDPDEKIIKDRTKWKNLESYGGLHGVLDTGILGEDNKGTYLHDPIHPYYPYTKDKNKIEAHKKFIESILETETLEFSELDKTFKWDGVKWSELKKK